MVRPYSPLAAALAFVLTAAPALAHGVAGADAAFLNTSTGLQLAPYFYLGAKHMVTGYDHLLFLFGVIFLLRHFRDIALYVTLFSLGHSTTLLLGVLGGWQVSPFLVDAVIGLSVAYKGFDNLSGFQTLFGRRPDPRWAVLLFGLVHGLGLASKLQEFTLSPEALLPNMLAFNLGVEVGQMLALALILPVVNALRHLRNYDRVSLVANIALCGAGLVLFFYQLAGHFLEVS
jgi:hypothetical protein